MAPGPVPPCADPPGSILAKVWQSPKGPAALERFRRGAEAVRSQLLNEQIPGERRYPQIHGAGQGQRPDIPRRSAADLSSGSRHRLTCGTEATPRSCRGAEKRLPRSGGWNRLLGVTADSAHDPPGSRSSPGEGEASVDLRAPNIMKHTLRCHGFGDAGPAKPSDSATGMHRAGSLRPKPCQPKRVEARIAASFVARLANTASIGCASLRAIDDSDSQRTRVSLC